VLFAVFVQFLLVCWPHALSVHSSPVSDPYRLESSGPVKLGVKYLAVFLSVRNVDDVHNLMDDVAEQQEIANEISDAISNPVGFQQDVDEVSFMCLVGSAGMLVILLFTV